jgi:hypothetical protein
MACYNSVKIDAPAQRVWQTVRDFHDMSWAPNVIENLDEVGDRSGTEVGARRVLNGVFEETLIALDDSKQRFRYTINEGPDAVSSENVQGYVGEVRVYPITEDNSSYVVWKSSWQSGGEGTKEFCDPIYQALLGDLKRGLAKRKAA